MSVLKTWWKKLKTHVKNLWFNGKWGLFLLLKVKNCNHTKSLVDFTYKKYEHDAQVLNAKIAGMLNNKCPRETDKKLFLKR